MLGAFINYIKRPFVGDQTTGRLAFQQYNGYAYAAYNGNGGFTVASSFRALNPGTITPGNTLKLNDPTVTSNNSVNLKVLPLSDDDTVTVSGLRNF